MGSLVLLSLSAGVAYFSAGEIYHYRDTVSRENLPGVDAIVCLGGGRGRITLAGDIWYQYWNDFRTNHPKLNRIPVLYLSGMGPQTSWAQISKQLKPQVIQAIRPIDVIIEKESSNTAANARWLARYSQEKHWNKILLLTSSYHMKRAEFIFDHILKTEKNPIELETLSVWQDPYTALSWKNEEIGIRVTMLEFIKWLYYILVWAKI